MALSELTPELVTMIWRNRYIREKNSILAFDNNEHAVLEPNHDQLPFNGEIEECQNGYTIYTYDFYDFTDILNLLGQMASQFNADYGYEKNPNKITDYQVTVIDFDENFRKNRHSIFKKVHSICSQILFQ